VKGRKCTDTVKLPLPGEESRPKRSHMVVAWVVLLTVGTGIDAAIAWAVFR
jgi:hypothetical protein